MKSEHKDYITLDGVTYERVSENSKTVALDIHPDILNMIDRMVRAGEYVSRGDAIRTIVREAIARDNANSSKKKPKQPVGPKKPSNPPRQPSRPPTRLPQRRGR